MVNTTLIRITPVNKGTELKDFEYQANEYMMSTVNYHLIDTTGLSFDLELIIAQALTSLNKGASIVNIYRYDGTKEEKSAAVADVLNMFKNGSYVICTTAYIHPAEFPPDKYYVYPFDCNPYNKKQVLFKDIMDKESPILTGLGFVGLREFYKKIGFIYPNGIGRQVLNYCIGEAWD